MNRSSRVIFSILVFFLFLGEGRADFPLPFPESAEVLDVVPEKPEKLSETTAKEMTATERELSPEISSETSEDRKVDVSEEPNSPVAVEKKETSTRVANSGTTKLPNLTDKKDKKKGHKKDDSDPSRASYERGLLRLRNGQKDAAKEEFSKAASTEGGSSSQAKLELSKLEDSKPIESNGEPVADDSVWKTSLESARSLRSQGKNAEAESILLRVATEGGNEFRSRALLQLGDMLFRQGKYGDSRAYLMDFWNRFGKIYPNAEDTNSREYKSQREEKELGAYLLFKASYRGGEGEWAKRFLRKYLDKTATESSGKYSPLRFEMESLSKSDL